MTLWIDGSEAAAVRATTVAAAMGTETEAAAGGTEAESMDWKRCHSELVRLAALRASLDWDEGRMLLLALRSGAHLKLGFAAFVEYVERLFGYRPRFTQEKLRVAEALEELPELDRALRDGELGWSAVRELTRVATLTTEKDWILAARGRTVRDVEKLVSGRKPGDRPADPARAEAKRHTLRFDVSGEVLATFRDAMAKLRRETGGKLDDDAALLLMARHVLGGPAEAGRSSYQLSLTVCERCRQAYQHGGGDAVEVGPEVVAMAECDAQQLGRVHGARPASSEEGSPSVTNPVHVGAAAPEPSERAAPGGVRASVAADRQAVPERVTQSIPPAVRRRVLERDGKKCSVPGCRHSDFLDLHHSRPRAEGGDHDPEYLLALCGAHHRAAHAGALVITGSYARGFVFRHADGRSYGATVSPEACELSQKVFHGLCGLGFRATEARRAIDRVVGGRAASQPMTAEVLLRKALAVLTGG